jgi:hypothetical protein
MTSKDPVASALKGQKQLADLHKAENSRVADLVRAGKVKGVDPGAIERIQKRKLQDAASKGDPKAVKKLEEMEKAKPKAKPGKRKPRFSGPEEVENKLKAIGYNYDPKALLNGAWIRMDPKGRSSTIAVPKSKLVDWANANPGDLVVPSWMKKQK